jgi:hypothetical protein
MTWEPRQTITTLRLTLTQPMTISRVSFRLLFLQRRLFYPTIKLGKLSLRLINIFLDTHVTLRTQIWFPIFIVLSVGNLSTMFLFLDVENVEITRKKEVASTENTLGLNHGSEAFLQVKELKLIFLNCGLPMATSIIWEATFLWVMLKRAPFLILLVTAARLVSARLMNLQEIALKLLITSREISLVPTSTFLWLTGRLGHAVLALVMTSGTWLLSWKLTWENGTIKIQSTTKSVLVTTKFIPTGSTTVTLSSIILNGSLKLLTSERTPFHHCY